MNYQEEIVVFKNDRIGDLMTSVPALRILIKENKDKLITIFLSKINHKIRFFVFWADNKLGYRKTLVLTILHT